MKKDFSPLAAALLTVVTATFLGGCEKKADEPTPPPPVKPADAKPPVANPSDPAAALKHVPVKKEAPKFPPLTEAKARAVLHEALTHLADDDLSRQALLHLADLGDKTALKAIQDELLSAQGTEFDNADAAAIGAEAMILLGEPGADAKALAAAKQALADDSYTEYTVHALARLEGAQRQAALPILATIAENEFDEVAAMFATESLARAPLPDAREVLARIAANANSVSQQRATAAAGLMRLGDPRGKQIADQLALGSQSDADPIPAEEVILGFGVEGAVEAVPYIKKMVEHVIVNDPPAMEEPGAAAHAIAAIYGKSGGGDAVPWLRELATRDDAEFESDVALALYTLGDDKLLPLLVQELEVCVANFDTPHWDMDPAIEILAAAAARGAADKAPFRTLVDAAAQVRAPKGAAPGSDEGLRSLNLAAAHAFLKSGGK